MKAVRTILYVKNQEQSKEFYRALLQKEPVLDVPGMTEFQLLENTYLGLMPEAGIKSLLGKKLPDPMRGNGIPRAELYLTVYSPEGYHKKALELGATELCAPKNHGWGDFAGYVMDPDGHVLAFSCPSEKSP